MQKRITKGLLMGDGWITNSGKNPQLKCSMVSEAFLNFLDEVFGNISSGVRKKYIGEEGAKRSKEAGLNENAKKQNYSDLYTWYSRRHPQFKAFREKWYPEGSKVFPSDIELEPMSLKVWYCCDGHKGKTKDTEYMTISCANERKNKEKIEKYFETILESVFLRWNEAPREDGSVRCFFRLSKADSMKLFDYMGEPLPGFEYKWPEVEQ
jgi:hypothetical protein